MHGAEACRYELRWQNPPGLWRPVLGAAVGAVAGAGRAGSGSTRRLVAIPLERGAFSASPASSGTRRRESRRKDAYLLSQNEGLMQSLHELERRHEEVLRAQREAEALTRELEARVEARTRELSEANAQARRARSSASGSSIG